MGENSKIEWTHHTFNPWWGCAKVSPACDHCYAERDAYRHRPNDALWGVKADRRVFGEPHWNEPRVWNRSAERAGVRRRVFCASMADVFDKNAPEGARDQLWKLIDETPHLDWLLLTKRIGNASEMLPARWLTQSGMPRNVWLGISVCNQAEAMRDVPKLYELPARVWFLSVEPLLGPIDFLAVFEQTARVVECCDDNACSRCRGGGITLEGPLPHWIIVGGESGHQARPMAQAWVDRIHGFCQDRAVPFFFKQWGEWIPDNQRPYRTDGVPFTFVEGQMVSRVGKKKAGRVYLEHTHDELPKLAAEVP